MRVRALQRRLGDFLRHILPYRCRLPAATGWCGSAPFASCTNAEARARKLLLRALSPRQRDEMQRCGYFFVDVANRGRFCILPSPYFNVLHIETGQCYCAVPRVAVPLSDLMLIQKLVLEHDAEAFFRVANCRCEIVPARVDEPSRPGMVLRARSEGRRERVRVSAISMIPHASHLP